MHLALEARRMQDQEPIPLLHTRQDLPPNTPFSYYIVGKPEEQSRVVRGVVTALHPDMLSVSHGLLGKKLKILVQIFFLFFFLLFFFFENLGMVLINLSFSGAGK